MWPVTWPRMAPSPSHGCVHMGTSYSCSDEECDQSFTLLDNLKRHQILKHNASAKYETLNVDIEESMYFEEVNETSGDYDVTRTIDWVQDLLKERFIIKTPLNCQNIVWKQMTHKFVAHLCQRVWKTWGGSGELFGLCETKAVCLNISRPEICPAAKLSLQNTRFHISGWRSVNTNKPRQIQTRRRVQYGWNEGIKAMLDVIGV